MLELFPLNGLDRSLHAPVFIGLLLLSLFKETLGWTFAGLVVPGYLAAVFIAAPTTGVLVVVESILAYLVAAIVGRWLPRTGAWSSAFGRERFFLLIVSALMVRLVIEGSLVPAVVDRYNLPHSRELFSLGLVLVPLLANSYWNAGLIAAFPRLTLVTLLTYFAVDSILLRYTNFTVSRFQIANESVSLAFLESPHAHIILVVGAMIAARNNVRYGWDYNGILVPALLAVAWYEPVKLATTMLEALLIYQLSLWLMALPPFSRLLVVGSRRLVVVYSVGFLLKWLVGFACQRWAPGIQMVDYFGFGYLLPTLLAVKMWNTGRVGSVLMPTLQVSVLAFVTGNALGFALGLTRVNESAAATTLPGPASSAPLAWELLLGNSAPGPIPAPSVAGRKSPGQAALDLAREVQLGAVSAELVAAAERAGVAVRLPGSDGFWVLRPRSSDPDADWIGPRFAVRAPASDRQPWVVVAETAAVGSAEPTVAEQIARTLRARIVLLRSQLPEVRAFDDRFLESLTQTLQLERILLVRAAGSKPTLSLVGDIPLGLDVAALSALLGTEVEVSWRRSQAKRGYLEDVPQLLLPSAQIEASAARLWAAPSHELWAAPVERTLEARLRELTTVEPGRHESASIEQLRLLGAAISDSLLGAAGPRAPTPWEAALAAKLGFRFAKVDAAPEAAPSWVLFEPGPNRSGRPTLIVSGRSNGAAAGGAANSSQADKLAVEVPAPRFEHGTFALGRALFSGLEANAFLMNGALPNDDRDRRSDPRSVRGSRSFYQRIHELWLTSAGHSVTVQGIASDRAVVGDLVISIGTEIENLSTAPAWIQHLSEPLRALGLDVAAFDGALERAAFEGAQNPSLAFARRFVPGSAAILWASAPLRDIVERPAHSTTLEPRLTRLGISLPRAQPDELLRQLRDCALGQALENCPPRLSSCDVAGTLDALETFNVTNNPFQLQAAINARTACVVRFVQDATSGRIWALFAGSAQAAAVPLGARLTKTAVTLNDRQALRVAMALGVSSVRLGAEP